MPPPLAGSASITSNSVGSEAGSDAPLDKSDRARCA